MVGGDDDEDGPECPLADHRGHILRRRRSLAVVELFVDPRLVGDVGADAAVAGGVVGDRCVAVHGVAVVPVERVVHALASCSPVRAGRSCNAPVIVGVEGLPVETG